MSFTVNIDTGNAAMDTPDHVAQELRRIAAALDLGFTEGPILDGNGNTVGSFDFTLDLTHDDDGPVLGHCPHGVDLDRDFCREGCRV